MNDPIPGLIPYAQGGGIVGAVIAIIYAIMWLRRTWSSDGVGVVRDRSESQILETALRERNEALEAAHEAWRTRAEDAKQIGLLSAQVEGLKELNHKTNNEVHLLRLLNEKLNKEVELLRIQIEALSRQLQAAHGRGAQE